jgi:hypothetical protein
MPEWVRAGADQHAGAEASQYGGQVRGPARAGQDAARGGELEPHRAILPQRGNGQRAGVVTG